MTAATRLQARGAFLARNGWGDALRSHLAGDASARSYERLALPDGRRGVLMDAPPGCGDDVTDFETIAQHLLALGLSAPEIWAVDPALGFMILEDLGDDLFTNLSKNPDLETKLYLEATRALLVLQAAHAPRRLADLSAQDWADSARLAATFYAQGATGKTPAADRFIAALQAAITAHADGDRVLILRDFHAGNLLWLPHRSGVARVGLLDFQLAQMGQPSYDLVSLLQDARRDVSPDTERLCLAEFAAASGKNIEDISAAYATMGALRALRILGIFARLCMVAGKDGYLIHMPRLWGQITRNLSHPALAELRAETLAILPEPTPEIINRIKSLCGSTPSL